MRYQSKVTIADEVYLFEHNTMQEFKDQLRQIDPRDLYQLSNIYIEDNGRPLDGPETLVTLILS